ncbi:translation initiation factor IF-2 N-terminal domain-containing protein [Rhodococcus sp. (in: high G+C Gram-positive bacteria)]|uniref:translation initiation factor IF-2 N-terminal domain-containing protein n=1 Tax=Rhodococcus sp. TaxID=1831 RepID=UPI00388D2D1F
MADQEPPENNSIESADVVADGTEAPNLPAKIRVHALAKMLGLTSKQVIAKATELGTALSSAHATLHRDVAREVYAALSGTSEPAAPAAPEGRTEAHAPEAPAAEPPDDTTLAHTAEPVLSPEPKVAEKDEPVQETSIGGPTGLFTSPEQHTPLFAPPEPVADTVAAPLFLQPVVPAPADEDADDEPVRPRRRRARRGAAAKDIDEQTVEKTAEKTSGKTPETTSDKVAGAEAPAEQVDEVPAGDTGSDGGRAQGPDDDDQDEHPRRRRRGRRGRGRGRGDSGENDQHDDTSSEHEDKSGKDDDRTETGPAADSGDDRNGKPAAADEEPSDQTKSDQSKSDHADSDDDSDDDEHSDGTSRRRRRRRRRRGSADSDTDTPNDDDAVPTVVHEREPRPKARVKDEVQGISGSTRLEAKRQRRRDGREAGRRRPPILTESEFLARRESVDRVMVVRERTSGAHAGMTQVAVLEDGILVEHFVTTSGSASMVGNIYLGRVQNVLPSMEAAFIDIGRGRNGVLYAGEVNWEAAGLGGNSRKIEQALKPGDMVVVQVSKDPVGHKGARLTTQISLAGRFLVYVPGGSSTGISRKLPDTERKRLKDILREIVPAEAGVIIRTAAEGVSEDELAHDVTRLQSQWDTISAQADKVQAEASGQPKALYEEPDLLVKVVRDLFNEDFSKLVIEGDNAWNTVESYIRTVAPDLLPRVERYRSNNSVDVFGAHRIDEQLAKALDRKVWLPSGGTLVIDRTEAMTVVDVNTGKFTGSGGNLEETVTRNNIEAAEEVVRQMRLRDIGGMIVVDFIDMVLESNRDLVLRRLTEALGRDRTRHQVSEVTSLGLVQMTRKRLGTGLVEAFSTTCEHCNGRGIIVHSEPIESKPHEESTRSQSGGSRRKRGRDKSAPEPVVEVVVEETTAPAPSQEELARRAAHPVALAMAAHHPEHSDYESADAPVSDSTDAPVAESATNGGADAPAAKTPADQDADPVKISEPLRAADPGRIADVARSESGTGEDATTVTTPADEPEEVAEEIAAAEAAVEKATPKSVEAEKVSAPESDTEPAPRRRRARRVARAAAPAGDAEAAATVIVLPAPAADSTPVTPPAAAPVSAPEDASPSADEPAVKVVRRTRSRRAAGRPAGPPVDAEA